jgi:hypothetical protein
VNRERRSQRPLRRAPSTTIGAPRRARVILPESLGVVAAGRPGCCAAPGRPVRPAHGRGGRVKDGPAGPVRRTALASLTRRRAPWDRPGGRDNGPVRGRVQGPGRGAAGEAVPHPVRLFPRKCRRDLRRPGAIRGLQSTQRPPLRAGEGGRASGSLSWLTSRSTATRSNGSAAGWKRAAQCLGDLTQPKPAVDARQVKLLACCRAGDLVLATGGGRVRAIGPDRPVREDRRGAGP